MSEIRFVYFDLGNVLARFDVQRACLNLHQRWAVDPEQVFEHLWTSGLQDRFEHGELSPDQFADAARRALQLDAQQAPTPELLDLLSDMFDPIEEMVDVIEAVRGVGVPVGILSNTCHAHWQWLLSRGYRAVGGPFASVILSFEHGAMKPHGSLYQIAAERAAVPPRAILFFDDRIENVIAAQQSGWQAHQFTDAEAAREVLRCKGVLTSCRL
jgi:glucose-1-phosphatase